MPLKQQILALDRPAPRYTSYPPATQFAPDEQGNERACQLAALPLAGRLSLYLHIPFCHQLCYYCGCFTSVTKKQARIEAYLSALKAEIALSAKMLPQGTRIAHLHFGGGSPTLLSPLQFADLMQCLRAHFSIEAQAEIAIEADPRQLSEAKMAAYAKGGVNRISFGVQDIDREVLRAVNREQGAHLTYRAVDWARRYGIHQINVDLMYGLPHQTPESLARTMAVITSMRPSRIAFFGYAHVPWMKNHMKAMDLAAMPDSAARYDLFQAGCDALTQAGYHSVGIDHFVREEDSMYKALKYRRLKRNFQGYTTDDLPFLLGLGASAISRLPVGYMQNKADVAAYEVALGEQQFAPQRVMQVPSQDAKAAAIIEQLMCYFEVDLHAFSGSPLREFALALKRLEPLCEAGLLDCGGGRITIRHQPQLLARIVASAFDTYTPWEQHMPDRHAQAV